MPKTVGSKRSSRRSSRKAMKGRKSSTKRRLSKTNKKSSRRRMSGGAKRSSRRSKRSSKATRKTMKGGSDEDSINIYSKTSTKKIDLKRHHVTYANSPDLFWNKKNLGEENIAEVAKLLPLFTKRLVLPGDSIGVDEAVINKIMNYVVIYDMLGIKNKNW